jgi:predicted kinase
MPKELQRGTSAVRIAQAVRNDIHAGRIEHGHQLPSTRVLAAEWGTSVATIVRAMAILADEGLVRNVDRVGRIVHFPAPESERKRPRIVMIGGYAGSGKTELGRIITRHTGWAILDKDTTTRPVVEVALEQLGSSPHDREGDTYRTLIRPAEYQALLDTVVENVKGGASVVATAPFISEFRDGSWGDLVSTTFEALEADLHIVWVRCDADSMHHYLVHRHAPRDAGKLANWDNYLAGVDLTYRPVLPHTIIDNSCGASPSLQEQAVDLLALLGVPA